MRLLIHFNVMLLSLFCTFVWGQNGQTSERCPPFRLHDFRGRAYAQSEVNTPTTIVAFLGTECPLAKLYAVRLNELARQFEGQLTILGINSNRQDSITEMAAFSRRHGLQYPMLKDVGAKLADQLGAQRTPEVFLLDRNRRICYRGRIDDQYGVGYARNAPTRHDLQVALEELLDGKEVSMPRTEPVGCFIGRPRKSPPTGNVSYAKHIAKILQSHCVECHREGQIAPFALTDYEEVVGWADTIREVIEAGRMPPWHAGPEHGSFANDRSLPAEDKSQLIQWIENGMPKGDNKDLPERRTFTEGWSLERSPDQIVEMGTKPFDVPAEGVVDYQYFVVNPQFKEDKWVSAAEVIPGNRSVVHHAIVFVRPPEGERQDGIGWLTAYVPGQTVMQLPVGMARKIPKGSQLVFQIHYTPIGSKAEDVTKIGLIFAEASSIHTEVQTRLAINRDFEIPPGIDNYEVSMSINSFPPKSKLWAIAPHMHYRGKSFEVVADTKSTAKTLLHVPNYDFNWQHAYVLAQPLPLEGVSIRAKAVFDNSENNLVNPDPLATVRWGDQTWEEMAMAYLAILVPRELGQKRIVRQNKSLVTERRGKRLLTIAEREERAHEIAQQFFAKMDANRDGVIAKSEASQSFRAFAWRHFDVNEDGELDRTEVLRQARMSLRP